MALLGGACGVLLSCVLFFYISAMVGGVYGHTYSTAGSYQRPGLCDASASIADCAEKVTFFRKAGLLRDEG